MIGQNKAKTNIKSINLIAYKNGVVAHNFILARTKTLIGSFEGADLYIDSKFISHYHAFITYMPATEEMKLIDLNSQNGTFVNGERVTEAIVYPGDRIQFGDIEFLIETFDDKISILDQDYGRVKVMEDKLITERLPELPPLPGLSLIDGEYCDIVFDEKSFHQISKVNFLDENISTRDYVDVTEEKNLFPIEEESHHDAIDITILSNGSILSSRFFKIKKDFQIKISNNTENKKTVLFEVFESQQDLEFISIVNGSVKVHKLDNFSYENLKNEDVDPFNGGMTLSLHDQDCIVMNHNSLQIIVRKTTAPSKLKGIPIFAREKEIFLHDSKTIGIIMSIMLLLLFVDTTMEKPEEPKKLSIIYKVKSRNIDNMDTQPMANKNVDKNLGQTKIDNSKKKVASAAAPKAKKTKVTKKKKIAVATNKVKTKTKKAKKPKMKAYEFKMKKSFANLFNKNKTIKNIRVSNNTNKSFDSSSSLVANATRAISTNSQSRKIAGLGSDFKGKGDRSFGTKGFSRSGFDTTSMSTKTIILGSIDPELLRKILREYIPQFRHCYQNELRDNSEEVKGVIDLNFRINSNGSVSKVKIKTKKTRFSNKGVGCMANVLRLIDFPSPKGGGLVDVRQPLNFLAERERIN